MMAKLRHWKTVGLGLTWLVAVASLTWGGFDLGDLLGDTVKATGIAVLVAKFGDDINNGINKLLMQNKAEIKQATKVVPIITVGKNGTHVGAAQVAGPQEKVDQVKAVAQLEASFIDKKFRAKVLVPISTQNVIEDINRVEGVGVSAVLDVKLRAL